MASLLESLRNFIVFVLITLKRLALFVVLPLALAAGALFIYTKIINWNTHAEHIAASVKQLTGRELLIAGTVEFAFMPSPHMVINDVRLSNISGGISDYFLAAKTLVVKPKLLSLLSGHVEADSITLNDGVVYGEILKDGRRNWDFSEARPGVNAAAEGIQVPANTELEVHHFGAHNMHIALANQATGYAHDVGVLEVTFSVQTLHGPFTFHGNFAGTSIMPIGFQGELGELAGAATIPLSLKLSPGASDIRLEGAVTDWGKDSVQFTGKLNGKLDKSLMPFAEALGFSSPLLYRFSDVNTETKPKAETRLEVSGDMKFSKKTASLENALIQGPTAKGAATIMVDYAAKPKIDVNIVMDSLDFDSDRQDASGNGGASAQGETYGAAGGSDASFRVGDIGFGQFYEVNLLKDIDLILNIAVKEAHVKHDIVKNLRVSIEPAANGMKLRLFTADLPGGNHVEMSGIFTDNGSKKVIPLVLNGPFKMEGPSFRSLLSWLKMDIPPLPNNRLAHFVIESQLQLDDEQMFFSSLNARIDETQVTAGEAVIRHGGQSSKLALTVNNINLDDYLPKLDEIAKEAGQEQAPQDANLEALNANFKKFDILRIVEVTFGALDLDLTLNNMVYKGKKVAQASALVRFGSGLLNFENINIIADALTLKGKVHIDATNLKPIIDADLQFGDFDSASIPNVRLFFSSQEASLEAEGVDPATVNARWSKESFDFSEFHNFEGKIKLYFHSFTHNNVRVDNLMVNGRIAADYIYLDSARGNLFESKMDIKGVMQTKIRPSLSVSFALSNANLQKAMAQLFGVTNIAGRFSMSGSLSTVGSDMRSMVSHLEGSTNLVARGLEMNGFDLLGLTQQLIKLVNIKDVRAATDKATSEGTTPFDYITGNLIINTGIITLNGITIANAALPVTTVVGSLNLPTWIYDITANFSLPLGGDVRQVGVPLPVKISGNIDAPQVTWDKSGIQKFWESRFYSGMKR